MSYPRTVVSLRSILIAVILVLLAACGENRGHEELLDRASRALAEGNVNAAVIDVKTALQQVPGDAAARRLYGDILLRQRDLLPAAEEFRRSLDTAFDPQVAIVYAATLVDGGEHQQVIDLTAEGYFDAVAAEPAFLATQARAEAAAGNYFAAADILDRAEAIDARLPAVRRVRGLLLARHVGDLEAAAKVLEELVEEQPEDADAWSLYAFILQSQNKLAEAERAFARAGKINRFRLPDRLNSVILLMALEKYEEVEAVIEQLEKLSPDHPGVNYTQAQLAILQGNSDEALEELDAVFKFLPQHETSLYLAANANLRSGNLATAQSRIEAFLAVRPTNMNAQLMLASIHLQQGNTGKALEIVREVLKVGPDNDTAMLIYARALAVERQYVESAAVFADIVAAKPDSASLRAEYVESLLYAGETDRATEELAEALEGAPGDADVRSRLINARIHLGDLEGSRSDIAAFSAAFPDSPVPSLMLAKIALIERDTEGTKRYLQEALEKDPGNASARLGLAGLAMSEQDFDQAAELLAVDLEQDKPDLQNLNALAAIETRRGDLEAMERVLQYAVKTHPEALEPRLTLARYMLRDGRPGEAVGLLMAVRERHEEDSRLQATLVSAFIELDQPGAAVNAGRKLAVLLPEDPLALRLAARAERLDGNLPEAEDLLRAAVELAPNDIKMRKLLLEVLVQQGEIKGTSEQLALFNKVFTDEQIIVLARARLALDAGDTAAVELVLRQAHQREPNSVSLLFLSRALFQNGRIDESVGLLDEWLDSHSNDGVILNELGVQQALLGRDDETAKVYEKLLAIYPKDVKVMNNLAWSLRKSAPERALALVEAALEQTPGNPSMLDTKAMAMMYAGDLDAALVTIDQVVDKVGPVPVIAFNRAQILAAAGRKDEARSVLNGLVEGPYFPEQKNAKALLDSL